MIQTVFQSDTLPPAERLGRFNDFHVNSCHPMRDTTAGALIRHQRLERARRDLSDPRLRDTPVHQIAARWGFKEHATFTRMFPAAYDTAPRDYRHQSLGLPA